MGLDFFRRVAELQERYRAARDDVREHDPDQRDADRPRVGARSSPSTGSSSGISIDGPRALHDGNRVDKGGKATFDDVMRGLRLLQEHKVEYNVLTTVNRLNGDYPLEVYRFLRDDVGTDWMQFIPVVERRGRRRAPGPDARDVGLGAVRAAGAVRAVPDGDLGRVGPQRRRARVRADVRGGDPEPLRGGGLRAVRVQRDVRRGSRAGAQRRPVLVRPLRGAGAPPGEHPAAADAGPGGVAAAAGVRGGQAGHAAADVPRVRRAVRVPRRVPQEPVPDHAGRGARAQLPVRRVHVASSGTSTGRRR